MPDCVPDAQNSSKVALVQLDEECIRRNISPGGCADLLAIGLFLVQLDRA